MTTDVQRSIDKKTSTVALVLLCGTISVALGLVYLFAAGAPRRYLLINAGALALGVAFATIERFVPIRNRVVVGATTMAIGLCLMATACFGVPVDGASRWIVVAGFSLQPSVILLPVAMVHFARNRDALSSLGLAIAGIALAWQPDRAMAGALVSGLGVLWIARPAPPVALALAAASAGFAATWLRSDTLPPVPYVERVFQSSFAVHPLVGLAVVAGLVMMLVPAVVGCMTRRAGREQLLVFGAVWLAMSVFAVLANYPTPLVGYGSSAIVGYCLSTTALD